jgi:16S rRNA G966 N2-methylase RsmD
VRGALTRLAEEGARFAVVLADPPYGDTVAGTLPAWLRDACALVLAEGGTLVLEVPAGAPRTLGEGLPCVRVRKMGETELWFHERGAVAPRVGARFPQGMRPAQEARPAEEGVE